MTASGAPPPYEPIPGRPPGALEGIPPALFVLLTLALIFFLYQVVGGVATLLLFGGGVSAGNVDAVRVATFVGQVLLLLVPTVAIARLRHREGPAFFRLVWPGWKPVLAAAVAVLALQQALQGYLVLQEAIPLPLPEAIADLIRRLRSMMEELTALMVGASSLPELLAVVLVVAVTPAVCEELLFRGLIQRNLEQVLPGVWGGVGAGVLFGLFHLNLFALLPLCALGAFFGYLVYRSGSIVPAMVAHFVNNLVAVLAVYLRWKEDSLLLDPGGDPTVSTGLLSLALFGLVFLGASSYFVTVTRPPGATEGGPAGGA
jgi:membrane protease YdiL (CAAX protease family)